MKYVCNICGWVYDEEEQGVKWEDLPEDFVCELCGVGKDDFSPLQSCLTLCNPIDGSPPGSPVPGILQARTPERVAISFSNA